MWQTKARSKLVLAKLVSIKFCLVGAVELWTKKLGSVLSLKDTHTHTHMDGFNFNSTLLGSNQAFAVVQISGDECRLCD